MELSSAPYYDHATHWKCSSFPNLIIFTSLYRTFSTSHGIEFTVNDRKIFYGLIPLSFTVCNCKNYSFFKSVHIQAKYSMKLLQLDPKGLLYHQHSARPLGAGQSSVGGLAQESYLCSLWTSRTLCLLQAMFLEVALSSTSSSHLPNGKGKVKVSANG